MTAQERLSVLHNIIAKVGVDGDLAGEFSKAMSMLNGFNSYQAINPPVPQITPTDNTGGIISPEMGQSMPTEQGGLNTPPIV